MSAAESVGVGSRAKRPERRRALAPSPAVPIEPAAGLRQERRSLRVRVRDLGWTWIDDSVLRLEFQLAPGAYATELLAELGEVRA